MPKTPEDSAEMIALIEKNKVNDLLIFNFVLVNECHRQNFGDANLKGKKKSYAWYAMSKKEKISFFFSNDVVRRTSLNN